MIEIIYVEYIPEQLKPNKLYISKRFKTASHLCACGCCNVVVTPLKNGFWRMTETRNGVTLSPSIGNYSFPCKSHYLIQNSQIVWLG